ncbi:MAG: FAD-dependent oxidoreductase, partial [Thermoprotei archaeon]
EHKLQCDKILLSVGRKPALAEGCAGSVGVATDSKGFVKVDASMRTSVKGVYAIGDLVAGPMLAHKAYRQGVVAAEAIAGLPSEFDSVVPDAIFTDPEAANVGLDLVKAGEAGYNAMSAKFPLMALGRAVSVDETKGFVKIVYERDSGVVLGIQIVGSNASDMIGEAALAVEMGSTLEDIASTIHPHPTYPEALMEAAEFGLGKAIHVVNRPSSKQLH